MSTTELPAWAHPGTDLRATTVLVIGGAGGVGEGVTRALLERGATVIATARTQTKLDDLAERVEHGDLHTMRLDVTDPGLPETLAAAEAEHGRLDAAVITIAHGGPQSSKRIIDLTDAEWDLMVEQNQTAIFRAYRALVPAIAPGGAIVHVNGMSAEIPFPSNGVIGLTGAATRSMVRTIAEEIEEGGARVHELVLGFIRTRPRRLLGIDDPGWIPALEVGVHVSELISGDSALAGTTLQYFVDHQAGPSSRPPTL
jgi:NAD(P)-dependent dehydrogenase (short-subunit alcohol dehydrogenase family)